MIDFNYTAPELLPLRIQEVLYSPDEPHKIGNMVYVPEKRVEELERENSKLTCKMSNMETKLLQAQERIDELILGSEREKELEQLVRDWIACDPKCTNRSCADCEHDEDEGCGLSRRMHELGVIA